MKKIIFITAAIFSLSLFSMSCGTTNSIGNTIQTVKKINDIAGTARNLSGVLSSTLGLDNAQKSSMTGILTDYITGTNGISSLASSNINDYARKLSGLNTNTLGKLKGLMTIAQYSKLLGLGGKSKSTDSLVKNLIGGSDLSTDALSVLSGLLF